MKLNRILMAAGCLLIWTATGTSPAATWSEPRALNPNATNESREDDGTPAMATDGRGNWVTVWGSNPSIGLDYEIYSARSDNNGTTWTGLTAVNSDAQFVSDGQDITHHIATDGNGTWIATWLKATSYTGPDGDIFFSRSTNNGTSWTELNFIDAEATSDTLGDMYPNVASDGKGVFVATWGAVDTRNPSSYRYYLKSSRSLDNGLTWEETQLVFPTDLYDGISANTCSKLETNGNGTWMAIVHSARATSTTTGTDFDIVGFRSTDNGETWSEPIVINSGATSDTITEQYPSISSDGNNTWVAAWSSVQSAGVHHIHVSKSVDDGLTWSPWQSVSAPGAPHDTSPMVESDGHGSWVVVWEDRKNSFDFEIAYSVSRDDATTWTYGGYLNSTSELDNADDGTPYLVSDQRGRWITIWPSAHRLPSGGGPDPEVNYSIAEFGNVSVEISSGTLDFGTHQIDVGASATLDLVLTNTGIGNVEFPAEGISLFGPSVDAFTFVEPPSLEPLPQDDSRVLTISFEPTNIGAHLALLQLETNAPSSPVFINLQGFGSTAPAAVEEWSLY